MYNIYIFSLFKLHFYIVSEAWLLITNPGCASILWTPFAPSISLLRPQGAHLPFYHLII